MCTFIERDFKVDPLDTNMKMSDVTHPFERDMSTFLITDKRHAKIYINSDYGSANTTKYSKTQDFIFVHGTTNGIRSIKHDLLQPRHLIRETV